MESALRHLSQHEQINFLLTNRIPRQALTRFVGWLSRIESPLLTKILIWVWRRFTDLNLDEAETQSFSSLQACFTRRLKPGARAVDKRTDIIISPCDAIVGECGRIQGQTVFQAKGFPYELSDLIPDLALQRQYQNGCYVTLRLKSSMYHRFHAPVDCKVKDICYISGDTWNVNPVALKRIEKLYCKNERAVVPLSQITTHGGLCLIPVAAILVASMKFTGMDEPLSLQYRGPNRIRWQKQFQKGDEMGYFQHGSTIIVLATSNYALCEGIQPGISLQMGQALLTDSSFHLHPEAP